PPGRRPPYPESGGRSEGRGGGGPVGFPTGFGRSAPGGWGWRHTPLSVSRTPSWVVHSFQRDTQLFQTGVQPGLDRAQRRAGDGADLLQGELLVKAQADDGGHFG